MFYLNIQAKPVCVQEKTNMHVHYLKYARVYFNIICCGVKKFARNQAVDQSTIPRVTKKNEKAIVSQDKRTQFPCCLFNIKVIRFAIRITVMIINTRTELIRKQSRPRGYKTFLCSTQLSMKFFLLINVKMPRIVGIFTFISRKNSILGLSKPDKS